jgi:hypothetical protein
MKPATMIGRQRSRVSTTVVAVETPLGTAKRTTANSIAENSPRTAVAVSASTLAMAWVATMPSSARAAAAANAIAIPTRVRVLSADELASNAVSAAPRPVAVTPSHAVRLSRWRSSRCARRAPNTGYVAVAVSA